MRASTLRLMAVALIATGCGDSTEPQIPTTLDLDQASVALEVRESTSITARILDQKGDAMEPMPEEYTVTWSRLNPGVVEVTDGVITGLGPGTATVIAQAGELGSLQVHVEVHPRELSAALDFEYDGDREGTFVVGSTFRILEGFAPDGPDWAVSVYHTEEGFQDLWAGQLTGEGRFDLMLLWSLGQVTTPGTHTVAGILLLGYVSTQQWDEAYVVTNGEITYSSATPERLMGTVALTLEDPQEPENSGENGDENGEGGPVLNVMDGTFDLPVVSMEELSMGPSSAVGNLASTSKPSRPSLSRVREAVLRDDRFRRR